MGIYLGSYICSRTLGNWYYSPEQQRAQRLWSVADEPLVNQIFDKIQDLEEVLAQRCQILSTTMTERIKNVTNYYWWPNNCSPLAG